MNVSPDWCAKISTEKWVTISRFSKKIYLSLWVIVVEQLSVSSFNFHNEIWKKKIFAYIYIYLFLISGFLGSSAQTLQAPRFITPPSASGSVVAEGRTKILQCQALGKKFNFPYLSCIQIKPLLGEIFFLPRLFFYGVGWSHKSIN